jgi:hypothetical protein
MIELEERKKELAADLAELETKAERFRHEQGSHCPLAKTLDTNKALGASWTKLEQDKALSLLYAGASGGSTLRRFGTTNEFVGHVKKSVTSYKPATNFLHYLQAEVLLTVRVPGSGDDQAAGWPPDNVVLINSPDIVADSRRREESKGSADVAAGMKMIEAEHERLVPLLPRLSRQLHEADVDKSGMIDKQEFLKAFEGLGLEPAIPKKELLALFALLDADGGGTIEMDDIQLVFETNQASVTASYDQEKAFDIMGDVADKILVLLDGKSSRFNRAELGVIKALHAKYASKMLFACADNHASKSALLRSIIDLLGDPSIGDGFAVVSPTKPDIIPFATSAVNAQQQQVSSLLVALAANIDSIIMRISALYAEARASKAEHQRAAAAGTGGGGRGSIDERAIASINKFLSTALQFHLRAIPKGGKKDKLIRDLKVALKQALRASESLLRSSHVTPLSVEDRRRMWRVEQEQTAKARQEVRDQDITSWDSARHIQAWLEALEVSEETRGVFVREQVQRLQDLVRVDDDKLDRWRVPLGDRLRIRRGLAEVQRLVAKQTCDLLKDGLWWLLSTEEHNKQKVTVTVPQQMLYDQGMDKPNLKGLRVGDTALLEASEHGKIRVKIPERSELEGCDFKLQVARRCLLACTHFRV